MISCESQTINLHQDKDENSSQCQHTAEPINPIHPPEMTLEHIQQVIEMGSQRDFESVLKSISLNINLNDSRQLLSNKKLHYRLMKIFYKRYKSMNEDNEFQQNQLLFIMSLMAEISRKNDKIKLPFTKNIVLAMLSFDEQTLKESFFGNQIILILSVLLSNLVKQGRTAVKLSVEKQLKNGLLLLISKVNEPFTLQILLKTIKQLLLTSNLTISKEQLQKYRVTLNLRNHFGDGIAVKLRIYLRHMKSKESSSVQGKTLADLVNQF